MLRQKRVSYITCLRVLIARFSFYLRALLTRDKYPSQVVSDLFRINYFIGYVSIIIFIIIINSFQFGIGKSDLSLRESIQVHLSKLKRL